MFLAHAAPRTEIRGNRKKNTHKGETNLFCPSLFFALSSGGLNPTPVRI